MVMHCKCVESSSSCSHWGTWVGNCESTALLEHLHILELHQQAKKDVRLAETVTYHNLENPDYSG